jgi:hypothetical protein
VPSYSRLALVIAAGASALAAAQLPFSSQGPQPGHTGAFGEPDCRACHYDYPLNEPGATITLDSLPLHYTPADTYSLRLLVRHAELKRGGFQLTARFEDGTPAGAFVIADTLGLRVQRARGIDYISHKAAGAGRVQGDSIVWEFDWVAPPSERRVVFSVAVNVANYDASEFGDRIFTTAFYTGGEPIRK